MFETMSPFQWGSGGTVLLPEDIERKKRLAQVMIERGTSAEPIQHWTQGLARVANALVGTLDERKADKAAQENRRQDSAMMAALLGVNAPGASAAPSATPGVPPSPSAEMPRQPRMAALPPTGAPTDAPTSDTIPAEPWKPVTPVVPEAADPRVDRAFEMFGSRSGVPVSKVAGAGGGAGRDAVAAALAAKVNGGPPAAPGGSMAMLPPVPAPPPGPPMAPTAAPASAAMPSTTASAGGDAAKRAAILQGLNSTNPTVQAIAKLEFAKLNKDPLEREKTALEIEKMRADINNAKFTTDQKDYDRAVAQGYKGTFLDYQKTISEAKKSSVNIDQRSEGEFEKETGKAQAKMYAGLSEDGPAARADLARIGALESTLSRTPGGALGGLQSMAVQWGIKLGPNVSDVEAANALVNQMVPAQRPVGAGSMSDRDVELFKQSLPRLSNTPDGNALILGTMRGMAEYRVKQAEIANMVTTGQMTRQDGLKALQALPNPLEQFRGGEKPQSTAAAPAVTAPKTGDVMDGYRFKGGNPADPNSWEKVK